MQFVEGAAVAYATTFKSVLAPVPCKTAVQVILKQRLNAKIE